MTSKLSLSIPTPCHENWDAMTPELQGRYCGQCSKTVVDFTLMTDGQILEALKKQTGSTCGRFATEQLQRPLQQPLQPKWYMHGVWKYMISALLFGKSIDAKSQHTKGKVAVERTKAGNAADSINNDVVEKEMNIRLGMLGTKVDLKQKKYTLIVTSETGAPISNANISFKHSNKNTVTDAKGKAIVTANIDSELDISYIGYATTTVRLNQPEIVVQLSMLKMQSFTVGFYVASEDDEIAYSGKNNLVYTITDERTNDILPGATVTITRNKKTETKIADEKGRVKIKRIGHNENVNLSVTSVGYKAFQTTINGTDFDNKNEKRTIKLQQQYNELEEVVVLGYSGTMKGYFLTGDIVTASEKIIEKPSIASKITKIIDTFFTKTSNVKIFPNPISAGGTISINYKSEREEFILIQLFAADGKWIMQEKMKIVKGENNLQFTIANNIPPQAAILTILNSVGKQATSQQIIIQ